MKVLLLAVAALLAPAADLSAVKSVYILPMSNGLDQFLAIKLTTGAVIQVVTDPHKADAVFSDRIGSSLEEKLDELYGNKSKDPEARPSMQPVSRGKGAIFLIDRKTRDVIWSSYELPKNTSPAELNHIAEKIAQKLEKDRKPAK